MADRPTKTRTVQVEIWTDRYRILGTVHIPLRTAYKGRLSDLLNRTDTPFLILTKVAISALETLLILWEGDFLAVNKQSIVLVKAVKE